MQTELSNHASDRFPPPETRPAGLTAEALRRQNRVFRGTGGVSAGNRAQGFAPAFRDTRTGTVYRARFADGRPAPAHLLEGLPPALVVERDAGGRATALHAAVTAGFVRGTRFFTREQAALAMNRTSSARIGQSRIAMIAHPASKPAVPAVSRARPARRFASAPR